MQGEVHAFGVKQEIFTLYTITPKIRSAIVLSMQSLAICYNMNMIVFIHYMQQ